MQFQPSLFDDGDRLGKVTEQEVHQLIEAAYPLLWQSLIAPWDDFQHSRLVDSRFRELTEGESAWWLHTQIKRTAETLIDDCPEFGLTATTNIHNQFYLNLNGDVVIVFKKLIRYWSKRECRSVLARSNYPTAHNCDWWAQRRLAGALDAPRVIVGYEETDAMTRIRVYVGYPRDRGRRFNWVYEMPDQIEAARRFAKPIAPAAEAAPVERKGFEVEAIREAEKRGAV